MPKLSQIASDIDAEKDGRWFSDPWGTGLRFKLARWGNKKFTDRLKQLREDYLADLREGEEIPDEEAHRIVIDAFAFAILVGWNVTDDDDKPEPYSHEAGIRTLSDPAFEDLYEWLFATSRSKAEYLRKIREEGLKN